VKVLVPSIACIRTVSRSGACGGNEARSARMSKPRPPCGCTRSGGNDLGGEQIWRPEHKGISAASKSRSAKSRVRGLEAGSRPSLLLGKPMTRRKKLANALRGTAVAWDQASEERFSEITSGTSRWQQGLIATCKDSSNEAKGRRRGEPEGMGAWVRKSDDRGVTSSKETEHVSPVQVTPAMGKGTLDPWWFHRQRGARTQSRDKPYV
jgi:hypothetical protein